MKTNNQTKWKLYFVNNKKKSEKMRELNLKDLHKNNELQSCIVRKDNSKY